MLLADSLALLMSNVELACIDLDVTILPIRLLMVSAMACDPDGAAGQRGNGQVCAEDAVEILIDGQTNATVRCSVRQAMTSTVKHPRFLRQIQIRQVVTKRFHCCTKRLGSPSLYF